jgi:hypothetical protein
MALDLVVRAEAGVGAEEAMIPGGSVEEGSGRSTTGMVSKPL